MIWGNSIIDKEELPEIPIKFYKPIHIYELQQKIYPKSLSTQSYLLKGDTLDDICEGIIPFYDVLMRTDCTVLTQAPKMITYLTPDELATKIISANPNYSYTKYYDLYDHSHKSCALYFHNKMKGE